MQHYAVFLRQPSLLSCWLQYNAALAPFRVSTAGNRRRCCITYSQLGTIHHSRMTSTVRWSVCTDQRVGRRRLAVWVNLIQLLVSERPVGVFSAAVEKSPKWHQFDSGAPDEQICPKRACMATRPKMRYVVCWWKLSTYGDKTGRVCCDFDAVAVLAFVVWGQRGGQSCKWSGSKINPQLYCTCPSQPVM